ILHDLDRRLVDCVGLVAETGDAVAHDADPRALQAVNVEELSVVGKDLVTVRGRGGIPRGSRLTGNGAKHSRGVSHGPAARSAHCVIMRYRHASGARLVNPSVGLIPTTPLAWAGQTMLPSVSVPREAAAKLPEVAAAEPELEPQGLRSMA